MRALIRFLLCIPPLILLSVGARLMYYGLETVVGASPNYGVLDVFWLLVGVIFFAGGIVTGILLLGLPINN